MVWLKHVKRPVMQPAVVEEGDRVVATNGPMNDQEPLNGHAPKEAYEPRGAHVMMRGTVNRRMVLGLGTAGVAGGSVLAEGLSSPALAATTTSRRGRLTSSPSPMHRQSRSTPPSETTSA